MKIVISLMENGSAVKKVTSSSPAVKTIKAKKAKVSKEGSKPRKGADKDEKLEQFLEDKEKRKKVNQKKKEAAGLEFFFGNKDSFIQAGEEEFEGHYPGNQNNSVLVPKKQEIVHG